MLELLKEKQMLDIIEDFYTDNNDKKDLIEKWHSFINFLHHSNFIKRNEKKFYLSYEYEDIIDTLDKAKNYIEEIEDNKENININNIANKIAKKYNKNTIIKKYSKSFEILDDFLKNEENFQKNIKQNSKDRKELNIFLNKFLINDINPDFLSNEEIIKEFSKLKNLKNLHIYNSLKDLETNKNLVLLKFYPYQDYDYGLLILLKFVPEWVKNNFSYNSLKNLFYKNSLKQFIQINSIYLEEISNIDLKKEIVINNINTNEDFLKFLEIYLSDKLKYIKFPDFNFKNSLINKDINNL